MLLTFIKLNVDYTKKLTPQNMQIPSALENIAPSLPNPVVCKDF